MTGSSRRTLGLIAALALFAVGNAHAATQPATPPDAAVKARTLSAAQRAAMAKDLARFAPVRADIIVFGDTKEITAFGAAISDTLQQAGWRPKLWPIARGIAYGVVGVPIFANGAGDDKAVEAAAALETDLRTARITAKKFQSFPEDTVMKEQFEAAWNEADVADVRLFVGLKPE